MIQRRAATQTVALIIHQLAREVQGDTGRKRSSSCHGMFKHPHSIHGREIVASSQNWTLRKEPGGWQTEVPTIQFNLAYTSVHCFQVNNSWHSTLHCSG